MTGCKSGCLLIVSITWFKHPAMYDLTSRTLPQAVRRGASVYNVLMVVKKLIHSSPNMLKDLKTFVLLTIINDVCAHCFIHLKISLLDSYRM